MDNEARLKRADDHIFSTGVEDGGASLGLANMRYGLAKIHYLQEQLGLPANAVFVSAPDLTVTRNATRWDSGYGYGGVINWGDGSLDLAVLDLKPNACGMIVGGLDDLVEMADLLERVHALKNEPVEIEGTPIQWDFGKGNHYIDLFEVDANEEVDLPPYAFIVHMAGGELRRATQHGPGLYWDNNPGLQAQMKVCETPFGPIRFLTGEEAFEHYEYYRRVDAFVQKRRLYAADRLFDHYHLINNDTHQGLTHPNEIMLGCYRFTDTEHIYPIGLRPDIDAYLVRGIPNLSPGKIQELGYEERARQAGVYDFLANVNILPHGGGYAYPHVARVMSVTILNEQRYFELEMTSGEGRQIISGIQNLPYEYRGKGVIERTLELEMAKVVARLKPVYVLKV